MPEPSREQAYIDYLDKESTLVGLLATVSVAASALLLQATVGAKDKSAAADLWRDGEGYIGTSAALFVAAAILFYRQRSLLAYYIGQLSLARALGTAPREEPDEEELTTDDLLRAANAWSTWSWYQAGWAFLAGAGAALLIALVTPTVSVLQETCAQVGINSVLVVLVSIVAFTLVQRLSGKDDEANEADAKRNAGGGAHAS